MECYCEPAEGESCDLWCETWRRARKEHKCCECKEIINPGDRYAYTFLIFEGEPHTFKRCSFCAEEVARLLRDNDHMNGLVPGELACALVAELRGDL